MNDILENVFVKKAVEEYELPLSYVYLIKDLMGERDEEALLLILLSMFIYLNNGSICIKNNENLKNLWINLGVSEVEKRISNFFSNINKYSEIIGDSKSYTPIIFDNNSLYFQKFYKSERAVKECLEERKGTSFKNNNIDEVKKYVSSLDNLDQFQKAAIFLSIIKDFVIISGGPGTGKTTVIRFIIDYLLQNKVYEEKEIAIATPTGKAAQRIKEIISEHNIETSTIHRLLKYNYINNSFYYNYDNKLPYRCIIVDEISMVDIVLLRNFLSAIPLETKLIIIGDKDQLPSVEAGAFISRIIPEGYKNSFSRLLKDIVDDEWIKEDGKDDIVLLTKSFRSTKNILDFATKVNSGDENFNINEFSFNEVENFFSFDDYIGVFEYKNPANFKKFYLKMLSTYFDEKYFSLINEFKKIESKELYFDNKIKALISKIEGFKILTLTNSGFYGCDRINEEFAKYLGMNIGAGFPIMINKNDYNLELFNGNIGILIKFKDGLKCVFANKKIVSFNMLPEYSIAFAITIHKSQGSEYERVLISIPEEVKPSLLTRQLLYTGVTRAKKAVLIAGSEDKIAFAIKNSIERESNI